MAEVRTRAGTPRLVVVHVEVQREREDEDFARRMWRYFVALTLREDKPIIPIALLFYQTAEGIAYEVYEETLFGHTVVTFRYRQISLARLAPQAYDYLQTGNILAVALASIMGRSLRGARRAQLYFDCLRHLLDAERAGEVNRAALQLLGAVIDTYLPVGVEDRAALRVQLQTTGGDIAMIEATELTWRDQVELEAGTRATRKDIRTIIQARFGRVSPAVESILEGMRSEEALDAFLRHATTAPTEDEVIERAQRRDAEEGTVAVESSAELTWRDQVEFEARRKAIRTIIQVRLGRVAPAVEAKLTGLQSEEALDDFLRRAAVAVTEDDLLQG